MKVAVLLSGCGVYDGSEIHESVFSLLALAEAGIEAICIAPDKLQMHVINHAKNEEQVQARNVLEESARIARGEITALSNVNIEDFDALLIPGGFGVAKNFTNWAVKGADSYIDDQLKDLIVNMHKAGKPIVALCMAPTVIAKAFEGTEVVPTLTVGTDQEPSPNDITRISKGMESVGSRVLMKTKMEIAIDKLNKIISAPCYMMEVSILEVRNNAKQAVDALVDMLKSS